jgi:hypothetical protein
MFRDNQSVPISRVKPSHTERTKVNQPSYRPGVAQRVPKNLRFPNFMKMAQDGGKVVSLTHRPPLPSGNTPGTHFY